MTTILSLPDTIYRIILNYEFIQPEDLLNLSYTCWRLWNAIAENKDIYWRKLFFQKLSHLKRLYDVLGFTYINYEEQMRLSVETRKKLHQYLSKMPETHYCMTTMFAPEEIEDFLPVFYPPAGANPMNYYFLMDELTIILQKDEDFGKQHYAHKLLYCVQIYYLRYEWHNFMSRSKQQQTLETVVGIIEQWFYLYYYEEHRILNIYEHIFPLMWNKSLYFRYMLDKYAKKVLETIQIEHPEHSLLLISKNQFLVWKDNNTYDCHWDKVEGLQILEAIYKIIYKYTISNGRDYYSDQKTFVKFEDRIFAFSSVVEDIPRRICFTSQIFYNTLHHEFFPPSFFIIFEGLARRFGIWISKLNEHALSWRAQCGMDDTYFYIDASYEWEGIWEFKTKKKFFGLDYTFITDRLKQISELSVNRVLRRKLSGGNFLGNFSVKNFWHLLDPRYLRLNMLERDEHFYSIERYRILQFWLLLEPDNILLLQSLYDYCKVTNGNSSMMVDALNRCKDPYQVVRNLEAIYPVMNPVMNLGISKLPYPFDYVQQRQITPKYRTEDVSRKIHYSVSMVVWYKEHNNPQGPLVPRVGIICGWYMDFDSLPEIAKPMVTVESAPYYKVLRWSEKSENDKLFYDNMSIYERGYNVKHIIYISTLAIIKCSFVELFNLERYKHTACGQYFSHFDKTHNVFIPNKMLASEYPDDMKEYMTEYTWRKKLGIDF